MDHENYVNHKADGEVADAPLVGNTPHARNEHYHIRAMQAIKNRGEKLKIFNIGDSEAEMKELLALLLGVDDDHAEILYEIMERVASCHYKKINRV